MNTLLRRLRREEEGSEAVEVTFALPLLAFILVAIFIGARYALAVQGVSAAASEAARTATLQRTGGDANADAVGSATLMLQAQHLHCSSISVSVDTSGFAIPVGTPASVRSTVTCQLELGDIALPGMPGSVTITRSGSSPLDTYRGRS